MRPAADLYLDKRKPSYIGGILEMANRRLYPHWGKLTTALRTGQPQGEAGPEETIPSPRSTLIPTGSRVSCAP